MCSNCQQSLYAVKILKSRGLSGKGLHNVTEAYIINRITYALPAWWGFTNTSDRQRLQAILNKSSKWGLDGGYNFCTLQEIVENLEKRFFKSIIHDDGHTLRQLLPPKKEITYNLRPRPHDFEIPRCSVLCSKNFINRKLQY